MHKKTNLFVTIMTLIGMVCTGVLIYVLVKKWKENDSDFEDENDFDFAEEFFEEENPESEAVEEKVEETPEEEEDPASIPKTRRGYIPLKFKASEIA